MIADLRRRSWDEGRKVMSLPPRRVKEKVMADAGCEQPVPPAAHLGRGAVAPHA